MTNNKIPQLQFSPHLLLKLRIEEIKSGSCDERLESCFDKALELATVKEGKVCGETAMPYLAVCLMREFAGDMPNITPQDAVALLDAIQTRVCVFLERLKAIS